MLVMSKDNGIESLLFKFMQLEDVERLNVLDWMEYDIQKYTGVDLNDAASVRTYMDSLFYNW